MRMASVTAAVLLWVLSGSLLAGVIKVPGDQPDIQSAIAIAQAGDTVAIQAGIYDENLDIDNKQDITLRPRGRGRVILDTNGSGRPLQISNSDRIRVTGIRFRNSPGASLTSFENSTGLRIDRCRFSNGLYGVWLSNCPGSVVRNCVIEDTEFGGVTILGADVVVEDNRIIRSASNAIQVYGQTITVRDNRIEGTGAAAILIGHATFPAIMNLIDGNTVRGALIDGILLFEETSSNTVISNRVIRPVGDGIDLDFGSNGQTLMRNRVTGASANGIVIGSSSNFLDHNRIIKAKQLGYYLQGTASVNLLQGNLAKKTGAGVEASNSDAFYVSGSDNLFLENRAVKTRDHDLYDNSGGANTYIDNRFKVIGP